MLWLILGLSCAFFYSVNHIITKRVISEEAPHYIVFLKLIMTATLALPVVIILWNRFEFNLIFFLSMMLVAISVFVTQILYMKSLKSSQISKSIPILALSPLFTVPIAYVVLGELPGIIGIGGLALIIIGAYILNFEEANKKKILAPFLAIWRNKGVRYMFIVAIIYGFGSVLDKFVINHSNVLSRLLLYTYFIIPFQIAFLLIKDRNQFPNLVKTTFSRTYKYLLLIIILEFLVLAMQFFGQTLTYTAYIITLKRASAIFSVILAYFFFKEKENFTTSIIGTILLVLGIALLIL